MSIAKHPVLTPVRFAWRSSKRFGQLLLSPLRKPLSVWQLVRLYGIGLTIDLFGRVRIPESERVIRRERIEGLASQIAKGELCPGSSLHQGKIYHDFPLPGLELPFYRNNTAVRLAKIKKYATIKGQRTLDIGCAVGGISLGLALLGAEEALGVDYDKDAIVLAREVANQYSIDSARFLASPIQELDLPKVDLIVWLSNWMWLVKALGLEAGKDLLFRIPQETGARAMIFESAGDDGKAPIKGLTQEDIQDLLLNATPYTRVQNIGPFRDNWKLHGKKRLVYLCDQPRMEWHGKQATLYRRSRDTVVKEYDAEGKWAFQNELECLKRLAEYDYFPKLLDSGDNWVKMSWCGRPVRTGSELEQINEILRVLGEVQIVHRDICPQNLLFNQGNLCLVDFEWATIEGQAPPMEPPEFLGRGFYDGHGKGSDGEAVRRVKKHFGV